MVLNSKLCRRGVLQWHKVYDKSHVIRSNDSKFGKKHMRASQRRVLSLVTWCFPQTCEKQLFRFMSVCLSVWLSVRIEQLGPHRMDFHEAWYLNSFRKSAEKIQVSWKSEKKWGTRHGTLHTFMIISRWSFLTRRIFSDKFVEVIKTYILCSQFVSPKIAPFMTLFLKEKNRQTQTGQDGSITRHMRFACWINKATDRQTDRHS